MERDTLVLLEFQEAWYEPQTGSVPASIFRLRSKKVSEDVENIQLYQRMN